MINCMINCSDSLFGNIESWGSRVALSSSDEKACTFQDLSETVRRVSEQLKDIISPQACVITVLPDHPSTVVAIASVCDFATAAPINPESTFSELEKFILNSDANAILVHEVSTIITSLAKEHDLSILQLKPIKNSHVADFDVEIVRRGGKNRTTEVAACLILQTSGSTGEPKLVALSRTNLLESAINIIETVDLKPSDVAVSVMPMFHIGAILDLFIVPLQAGSGVRFAHPFSSQSLVEAIKHGNATWFQAVPTMLQSILNLMPEDSLKEIASSIRFIRSVSSDLAPTVHSDAEAKFGGVPIIQMYGMSETAGQITSNPLPPKKRKIGSVGIPGGTEVIILDRYGNAVAQGLEGEICVSGPTVMSDYVSSESTLNFYGRWFRTGDLGRIDEDGYLFISGRIKDMINCGGEKISALEVEQELLEHEDVAAAAVVAIEHMTLGEEVGAAVVMKTESQIDEASLKKFLAAKLAEFKHPRRILFLESLPKLGSGKIHKTAIKNFFKDTAKRNDVRKAQTAVGEKIARIWASALKTPLPGLEDDFFDAGGDSLSAQSFMIDLENELGIRLPANLLYESPTLAELEKAISALDINIERSELSQEIFDVVKAGSAAWKGMRRSNNSLVVCLRGIGEKYPFFFCTASQESYIDLANALDRNRPFYALRSLGGQSIESRPNERELAKYYASEIDDIYPDGPVILGGLCGGVRVARDIVKELNLLGRNVGLLVEIDDLLDEPYSGRAALIFSSQNSPMREFTNLNRWIGYRYSGEVETTYVDVQHMKITRGKIATQIAEFIEPLLEQVSCSPQLIGEKKDGYEYLAQIRAEREKLHSAKIKVSMNRFANIGDKMTVRAQVKNTSAEVWEPSPKSGLRLLSKWQRRNGTVIVDIAGKCDLDERVEPGETVTLEFQVTFPNCRSPLYLITDMVDDGLCWFHKTQGEHNRHLVISKSWRRMKSQNLIETAVGQR